MYQALYRKWRSRTFDEVVGQRHVTETLKRQVQSGRLSHAYLFTGTRGTGKTTCAKLLARAVNCQDPQDGNPCNRCPACLGIESGSILDVMELDAASNNRVDDVRAILDEAVYTPASVKKRVYIIDEVHMLSPQAFNALLQILEEPPAHLMFILATTELHKVPATIKSRCQQFAFRRIRAEDIAGHLLDVASAEGIPLTQEGAALIARLSDGGMRDALSLLDQCAVSGERVDEGKIYDVLGLAGNLEAAALLENAADGDVEAALVRLGALYDGGKEMSALIGELSGLVRDLLVRKTAPSTGASLMTGGFDEETMRRLSERFTAPRLVQMLRLLQQSAAGLARSANRRTDAELCLAALCDPSLDPSPAGLSARIARLEQGEQPARTPAPKPAQRTEQVRPKAVQTAAQEPEPANYTSPEEDRPPWEDEDRLNSLLGSPPSEPEAQPEPEVKPEPKLEAQPEPGPEVKPGPEPEPQPAPEAKSAASRWPGWDAFRDQLKSRMDIGSRAMLGKAEGCLSGKVLTIWTPSDFVRDELETPDVLRLIAQLAGELTGGPVHVEFQVGAPPAAGDALSDFLSAGAGNVTVE